MYDLSLIRPKQLIRKFSKAQSSAEHGYTAVTTTVNHFKQSSNDVVAVYVWSPFDCQLKRVPLDLRLNYNLRVIPSLSPYLSFAAGGLNIISNDEILQDWPR